MTPASYATLAPFRVRRPPTRVPIPPLPTRSSARATRPLDGQIRARRLGRIAAGACCAAGSAAGRGRRIDAPSIPSPSPTQFRRDRSPSAVQPTEYGQSLRLRASAAGRVKTDGTDPSRVAGGGCRVGGGGGAIAYSLDSS
eukprot:360666-Chlamydomonas_euryale.AAC.1